MEIKKNKSIRVISAVGIVIFIAEVLAQVAGVLVASFFKKFREDIFLKPWFSLLLTVIALYCIMFPIYLIMMKFVPEKESRMKNDENYYKLKYSFSQVIILFIVCLSITYLTNFLSVGIIKLVEVIKGESLINPLEELLGEVNIIYTFIVACVIGPIVEEIMFRKIIIDKLVGYGEKIAVYISAITFGLFHGNLFQVFYAFLLGIILAWITVKTGKIRYAIVLHILINTFGTIVFPLMAEANSQIVVALAGWIIIAIIICGIIMLIKYNKKLFPKLDEKDLLDGDKPMPIIKGIMSPGIIAYILGAILFIILGLMNM